MAAKSTSKIKIKPSKKGTFTAYCKRKGHKGVTSSCISQAKRSGSKAIKKKAVFAENARKWRRESDGYENIRKDCACEEG